MQINIPPFAIGTILFKYEYYRANNPYGILYQDYETKVQLQYYNQIMRMRVLLEHPQIDERQFLKIHFTDEKMEGKPHFYEYNIFKTAAKEFIIEGSIAVPKPCTNYNDAWYFTARIKSSYMPKGIEFWDVME